jgi:hypothetical protein
LVQGELTIQQDGTATPSKQPVIAERLLLQPQHQVMPVSMHVQLAHLKGDVLQPQLHVMAVSSQIPIELCNLLPMMTFDCEHSRSMLMYAG